VNFHNPYSHGFVRTAVCVPRVHLSNPARNADATIALARDAAEEGAALVLFPELGTAGYSNDDLFQQDALLEGVKIALARIAEASRKIAPVLVVGAPLEVKGRLYNCGVVIQDGSILGVIPKSYLPNYREFYEHRQFAAARTAAVREFRLCGQTVPFGTDLIFECENVKGFSLAVEVCEDVWTPIPPSTYAAMAGATVIANLSASNITIGKAEYRKVLCSAHAGRCVAAYLYSAAGFGESTTDLGWDGHALIYENSDLLAESERFADGPRTILADVDLERLRQDRMRLSSFHDAVGDHQEAVRSFRRVRFSFQLPSGKLPLRRTVERFPYVPGDPAVLNERCFEAYNIQVQGLMRRLEAAGLKHIVIGVSGGLDSMQALLVAVRTFDRMGLPRTNILGYSMPGFATRDHTRSNAWALMKALGVSAEEIDIRPSCTQMLEDIGHPFARGEKVYDVTFENVQAGERTSHLFRLANRHDALVLGTGDLSEIALGWSTYGVGDQMSHYNVNPSVSKTLMQHLIRWTLSREDFDDETERVIRSILETEISPELVPGDDSEGGTPAQSTEAAIGPYELHDFTLYYVSRFGFRPSKVAFLALHAWGDRARGVWPPLITEENRRQYDLATIRKWMRVFLWRFFQTSQFKRSAMPNGPKVGSGGSLSPRGDWRAPSDGDATVWIEELDANVPES
jgi:NAD+ synthase (glutamine-hydrolysing)